MRKIYQITYFTILAAVIYACGGAEAGNDKLAELQALKDQKKELEVQIAELENELMEIGAIAEKKVNKVLVTAKTLTAEPFIHRIEVRGEVASKKNVFVSAETMGKIKSINVTEGQKVKYGQLLLQLDAEILKNNIAEVKTQLELATTIFERQANLWEKNIGTEVQYLQTKNNKESLERKLTTLNSQLKQSNVYAPFSGIIDNIPARVGEMAQPGLPLVRIVNQDEMYISADVSESLLGSFSEGQKVEIYFPSQDKSVVSTIESLGQVIKSENRTFEIEVKLPRVNFPVKPNQVTVLKLVDYSNEKALVVPTKVVQRDSKGNYVYALKSNGDQKVATKVYIKPGVTYDQRTEILEGLNEGQVVALEGYRDLAEDVAVNITK
ncbi:MAG: efflux RND transporter periplasmic adaptor subunit [Cyclobacteriaceae bacterium]